VKDRRFTSRVIYLGSASEVVKLVVNPELQRLITPALQARLDSARVAIASGTLHPPRIEFVDTVVAR
jgi:hypothetical protein